MRTVDVRNVQVCGHSSVKFENINQRTRTQVPLAYMYQVFLFKESPSTWSIVGAFLVLSSVVAIVIFRDKRSENKVNSNGIQVSKYGGIPDEHDDNEEVEL